MTTPERERLGGGGESETPRPPFCGSENDLGPSGATALAPALSHLVALRELYLGCPPHPP